MKKLIYLLMFIMSSNLYATGLKPGSNSLEIPEEVVTVRDLKKYISQSNNNAHVTIIFNAIRLDDSAILRDLQNLNSKSLHIILTSIR